MRFLHRQRPARTPIELNVIPLIDVVFFLLIFYVISSSVTQESAVALERPTSSQASPVSSGFVPVAIITSGAIVIGSQEVALASLPAAVRAAMDAANTRQVVVIPDRAVPAGELLQVMDACSAGGASAVDVAATREVP